MAEFLNGVLEAVRTRLPEELREFEARRQGSLIKLFGDEPAIHYELWLHRRRGRGELGLHFETRDAQRNRQLLEYVAAVAEYRWSSYMTPVDCGTQGRPLHRQTW